jgi:hypothetical protein
MRAKFRCSIDLQALESYYIYTSIETTYGAFALGQRAFGAKIAHIALDSALGLASFGVTFRLVFARRCAPFGRRAPQAIAHIDLSLDVGHSTQSQLHRSQRFQQLHMYRWLDIVSARCDRFFDA